jgi:hypothetical protein
MNAYNFSPFSPITFRFNVQFDDRDLNNSIEANSTEFYLCSQPLSLTNFFPVASNPNESIIMNSIVQLADNITQEQLSSEINRKVKQQLITDFKLNSYPNFSIDSVIISTDSGMNQSQASVSVSVAPANDKVYYLPNNVNLKYTYALKTNPANYAFNTNIGSIALPHATANTLPTSQAILNHFFIANKVIVNRELILPDSAFKVSEISGSSAVITLTLNGHSTNYTVEYKIAKRLIDIFPKRSIPITKNILDSGNIDQIKTNFIDALYQQNSSATNDLPKTFFSNTSSADLQ